MKMWEEMTTLEQYECTYSDMFKDAHGFRPRGMLMPTTEEEYEEEFTRLQRLIGIHMAEEAEFEELAIEEFKKNLDSVIAAGAGDRDTAIRWMAESKDFYGIQDVESYVYGLGFLFTDYGRALVKKIDSLIVYKEWKHEKDQADLFDDMFG
jgi:hypothetical protein